MPKPLHPTALAQQIRTICNNWPYYLMDKSPVPQYSVLIQKLSAGKSYARSHADFTEVKNQLVEADLAEVELRLLSSRSKQKYFQSLSN